MNTTSSIYDIAIIGAGAAGCMAAIRASDGCRRVILIDKNQAIGCKLLLTGHHRCNLTNTASIDNMVTAFEHAGRFLKPSLLTFSNQHLQDLFARHGLALKVEDNGRVFPATDRSRSVIAVLEELLKKNSVSTCFHTCVLDIEKNDDLFCLRAHDPVLIRAKKLIIATGGCSYPKTGSTGDGMRFAKIFGHKTLTVFPALTPLKTEDAWVRSLQGISIKNVTVALIDRTKKVVYGPGEILFTHFGVSGPLILDISRSAVKALTQNPTATLFLNFLPSTKPQDLEKEILKACSRPMASTVGDFLRDYLPKNVAKALLTLITLPAEKRLNQITKNDRKALMMILQKQPLTINGYLSWESAMATEGGVAMEDINPKTMGSRLVPGLYFAGETIEGRGPSGGYNLQQAFSTGYLAGESARKSLQE